ncbi:MAG: BatD family protein [Bacteroides sp.]|nr:BatD family protein [Bacteroides sp.]
MRKLFFLLFSLLFVIDYAYADVKPVFTASAPDVIVVGDQFRLTYVVTTQNVKDFRAPGSITGFDILMGPSRSQQSSTQIINGKVSSSSSITYTYILMANKEGTFSIPAASIVADGEQLISNSVNIKVLPKDQANNSSGSANTGSSGSSSGGNNNASKPSTNSSGSSISNQDLFIAATATKTNIYEQEAFLLTYKIYTLVELEGFDNIKLPDFKGFLSQEIEQSNDKRWQLEHYNGRNYHTTIYRQFVLFPQQGGELTIEPARFDASIRKVIRSIDPFDAFFNGGSNYTQIKKTLYTPTVKINVSALPAGKPAGFSGGVGNFNITSSINSQQIKTNDAITIKLVISGTGNLKLIANPNIEFPSDFEVYDPKVDNRVRLTRDGNTGNKVIEYLAIARHPGTFKIPGVTFSYFDIKSKSYKTLKTEDYEVVVERGEGNADQVVANFTNKEDIKVLGEDIRFIKLNEVKLHPKGQFFYGSMLYWMFYIIPLIAFILFFIVYRKQAIENANVAKVRTKKANKMATKRLKLAGKLLAENKKDEFYDEVLKALWGYISDKLNIPVSRLSKDNIEEKLMKHGVSDELIKEFLNALHECEFARFAPGDESQAMDNVYSVALNVISKIENSIKR